MHRRATIHRVTEDGDINELNKAGNTVVTLIRAAPKRAIAVSFDDDTVIGHSIDAAC